MLLSSCVVTRPVLPASIMPRGKLEEIRCASLAVYKGDDLLGSATLVKYRGRILVLTAAHVVLAQQKGQSVIESDLGVGYTCNEELGFIPEGITPIEVKYVDEQDDIAVIKPIHLPPVLGLHAVPLADIHPAVGDFVIIVGNPVDFVAHIKNVSYGVISGIENYNGTLTYRTDADIYYGNSGGGAFNTRGEYVGMAVGIAITLLRSTIPGSGKLVALSTIEKHLDAYINK